MNRIADASVIEGFILLRSRSETRITHVRQRSDAFFGEVDGAQLIGIEGFPVHGGTREVLVIDVCPHLEFQAWRLRGAHSIALEEISLRLGDWILNTLIVAYRRDPYFEMAAEVLA